MFERHVDEDDEDDDVIDEVRPRILLVPVIDTRFTLIARCNKQVKARSEHVCKKK